MTVRPAIKSVTGEIKSTYVAKEYKSHPKKNAIDNPKKIKSKSKSIDQAEEYISLDTQITLKRFEKFKYDLESIRLGQAVKPVYLSKLPKDLKKKKSTQTKKETFIKIVMP
jgi:hypothetical protein